MRGLFYMMAFIGCSMIAVAQPYNSVKGHFQSDFIRGCAPLTINLTIITPGQCQGGNPCAINYGDNSPMETVPTPHTFTQPGTYIVNVLFQGGVDTDQITITVDQNIQPTFEIYNCNANEVSINVTDRNYQEYVIGYSDGAQGIIDAGDNFRHEHTFSTAGAASVNIRGRNANAADNCSFTAIDFDIKALTTASINLVEVLNPNEIELNLETEDFIQYRLEAAVNNSNTFQILKTNYNSDNELLTTLRPDDNSYCFRLSTFNPCANAVVGTSNIVCSINFDVAAQNNQNNLTWSTSSTGLAPPNPFGINRTPSFSGTVSDNLSPYSDTEITCGTEYCYQLASQYTSGATSISMQKCVTAFSSDAPEPIQNISTIVNDPGVSVIWTLPGSNTPQEYDVFKAIGSSVSSIGTTPTQVLDDPTYTAEAGGCYRIRYHDVCGNTSAFSNDACPVQLNGDVSGDNVINLSWTGYNGWQNGVSSYVIEKYSGDGQLLLTLDVGNTLSYSDNTIDYDNQTYRYIVRAIANDDNLPESFSNEFVISKRSNIFYPTAFTPNGDGLNDLFTVGGKYIAEFEMNIFNRWGELVFNSRAIDQGWDGTFKGNPMPESTYTFVAEIKDLAGRTFKESGSFLLLRKN